jgi:hypothetical protein
MTRQPYAHDAVVRMAPDADIRAVGAAVTVALCGHWDHQPPCPLAAHHTRADRVDDEVRVRILFATEPDREAEVRDRIAAALAAGHLDGPDGPVAWRLDHAGASPVAPEEAEHAARIAS